MEKLLQLEKILILQLILRLLMQLETHNIGIIDEHSHMAASSINEGGHNSSAEVSIMDVINPDDINIYRNLGGGVTTVQILHGSANPIGGQSAIIKLKWGSEIDECSTKMLLHL